MAAQSLGKNHDLIFFFNIHLEYWVYYICIIIKKNSDWAYIACTVQCAQFHSYTVHIYTSIKRTARICFIIYYNKNTFGKNTKKKYISQIGYSST